MELKDFETYPQNNRFYGGDAGRKYGVIIDGENWLIKFAKSTVEHKKPAVSYTTSPLSEHLGSKIYSSLGIPVHETVLGIREGKLVVACRDFIAPGEKLVEFKELKNAYKSQSDSKNDGTGASVQLTEVLEVIDHHRLLKTIPGIKERFWDMFVVDAIIGNPDRNNGNWGLVSSDFTDEVTLAPVYDNGNGFFNTRDDALYEKRLDGRLLAEDALGTPTSVFTELREDGKYHKIHSFHYLLKTEKPEAVQSAKKIMAFWDQKKINTILDSVPSSYLGLEVITPNQREFYKRLLTKRVNDSEKGLRAVCSRDIPGVDARKTDDH